MTIAAGFKARGGVLLCADTMHQGGYSKSHQSKIDRFKIDNSCVLAFVFAGHEPIAKMAMQDCVEAVSESSDRTFRGVRSILRTVLKRVNEEYVDSRPQNEIDFWRFDFLICVWLASERMARLLVTAGPVLVEVKDFDLRGTGADIGRYVISTSGFSSSMHMADVATIANQAVVAAKDFDPSCGGRTQFLGIRNSDGGPWAPGIFFESTEDFILAYWRHSGRLLANLAKTEVSKSELRKALSKFQKSVIASRQYLERKRKLIRLTAEVTAIGPDPADAPRPQGSKVD